MYTNLNKPATQALQKNTEEAKLQTRHCIHRNKLRLENKYRNYSIFCIYFQHISAYYKFEIHTQNVTATSWNSANEYRFLQNILQACYCFSCTSSNCIRLYTEIKLWVLITHNSLWKIIQYHSAVAVSSTGVRCSCLPNWLKFPFSLKSWLWWCLQYRRCSWAT